jgi:GntR family transcriptional regulator / MocR family aminotransferase
MNLTVSLDAKDEAPLHRQLYGGIRRAILAGRFGPGQRLPSTRAMAQSLGLSRTTVAQSYDDLISEGYLITVRGSGTFVCQELPEELLRSRPSPSVPAPQSAGKRLESNLSRYGRSLAAPLHFELARTNAPISFSYGHPDFEAVPFREWGRLLSRHCRSGSRKMLDYADDPLGHPPLREAVARYLGVARAVQCSPDQVVILNGAQQSLDLVARLIIDPGDAVALENPGYPGSFHTFRSQGARLIPIPVDASGIAVSQLYRHSKAKIKVVYVTPSHQFPTGAALSLPRRLELLAWAQQTGALIIEDDYDSEYRYGGRPIPALQGLGEGDSVVYVGTFSKVLFPSLRIAYLVAPRKLVPLISRAKWLADRQTSYVEQYALTDFINDGSLERHIRRMRTLYSSRRQALVRHLNAHLGSRATVIGENAGMQLMARISTGMTDEQFIARALGCRVSLSSAGHCYLTESRGGEFIMGFAGLGEKSICEGVRRLAQALDNPPRN